MNIANRTSYTYKDNLSQSSWEVCPNKIFCLMVVPKQTPHNYIFSMFFLPGISVPSTPEHVELSTSKKRSAPDSRESTPPHHPFHEEEPEATPPLPPRQLRNKQQSNTKIPKLPPRKRGTRGAENGFGVIARENGHSQRSLTSDDTDGVPPRPPKRRRLSGNTSSPSLNKSAASLPKVSISTV